MSCSAFPSVVYSCNMFQSIIVWKKKRRNIIKCRSKGQYILAKKEKILAVTDSRHFFSIPIKTEHHLATLTESYCPSYFLLHSSCSLLISKQSLLRSLICSPGVFAATVEPHYERCSIRILEGIWHYQSIVR